MKTLIPLLFCLSGCSLFGPPVPITPRADVLAWQAAPQFAHDQFVTCASKYASSHALPDVNPELIASVAISACQDDFDRYHAMVAERNAVSGRTLGIWSHAETYNRGSDKAITEDARKAALRAILDTRAKQTRT